MLRPGHAALNASEQNTLPSLTPPSQASGGFANVMEGLANVAKQIGVESEWESGTIDTSTIHGVPTGYAGKSGGTGRRYIQQDAIVDPAGGFKGVLEGAYSADKDNELVERVEKEREVQEEGSQFSSNWPRSSPNRAKSPTRSLGSVIAATAAVTTMRGGTFALNRKSSVPFATEATVAKVEDTLQSYEADLMKMGMDNGLLKGELDKLGREKKTGSNMRRSREIEGIMEDKEKEMSKLRRICKEKKEELGLA